MYDIRARNSFQDRAAAGPRTFDVAYRRRSKGADIALPEGRIAARDRPRARKAARNGGRVPAPLVDRIETILGNRLWAANDARRRSSAGAGRS